MIISVLGSQKQTSGLQQHARSVAVLLLDLSSIASVEDPSVPHTDSYDEGEDSVHWQNTQVRILPACSATLLKTDLS